MKAFCPFCFNLLPEDKEQGKVLDYCVSCETVIRFCFRIPLDSGKVERVEKVEKIQP